MNKLAYDICRCAGVGCAKKEQCLRHTDTPPDGVRYSMCAALCTDENTINFIKDDNDTAK